MMELPEIEGRLFGLREMEKKSRWYIRDGRVPLVNNLFFNLII